MATTKWGIMSTGNISNAFAYDLTLIEDAEVYAVASRTQDKAQAFADKYSIPVAYDNYQALADDPDIDVIYIGTPHPMHQDNTIMCLEAGKAVVCEKPFAMNQHEAQRMIDMAKEKNLFLMEAVWSRFFPLVRQLKAIQESGELGAVKMVTASFGFRAEHGPEHRLFNIELGGGALLDLGIYPIQIATMLLGMPDEISSQAIMGDTGVDVNEGYVFKYNSGAIANLSASLTANLPSEANIIFEEGRVKLHFPFWNPTQMSIERHGQEVETIHEERWGGGYTYEAVATMEAIREGKIEHEAMSHEETMTLAKIMDEIRGQWGLKYPME